MSLPFHLLITDSGLGGLSICAAIERQLRSATSRRALRITYVNAWPEEARGFNDLPDMAARARTFDRALAAMEAMAPDAILIACNTLSIVFEWTAHRARASVPVQGIVDTGVHVFANALRASAASAIVLIGTRTTIESGVHRDRLVAEGLSADRIGAASCHGLATAIESDAGSDATATLIEMCAARAVAAAPDGAPLHVGLCCTHYGMVADRIRAAVQGHADRDVTILDPNVRLAEDVARRVRESDADAQATDFPPPISIEVVSKVRLDAKRDGVSALVEAVSPRSAAALRGYRHVPDLF